MLTAVVAAVEQGLHRRVRQRQHRTRESNREVQPLILRPAPRSAMARHLEVGDDVDRRVDHLVAMREVEDDVRWPSGRKPVTMQPGTQCRRQLRPDVVVAERHGVVAGLGLFHRVRERGRVAGCAIEAVAQPRLARRRHQEDVAVVRNAGAAQVGVREADDAVVAVVVAGGGIPAGQPRVRAWLDHSERQARTGKRVAVTTSTDERIDVRRQAIGLCRGLRRRAPVCRTHEQHDHRDVRDCPE